MLASILLLLSISSVSADDTPRGQGAAATGAGEKSIAGGSQPGDVDLSRLLKLPSDMRFDQERRGGATQGEWRIRFATRRTKLREAQLALETSQRELEEVAGSAGWQVAPPGSNQTETSPVSFKLREDVRSNRDLVKEEERNYRALVIEADLADVPESWRSAPDE